MKTQDERLVKYHLELNKLKSKFLKFEIPTMEYEIKKAKLKKEYG